MTKLNILIISILCYIQGYSQKVIYLHESIQVRYDSLTFSYDFDKLNQFENEIQNSYSGDTLIFKNIKDSSLNFMLIKEVNDILIIEKVNISENRIKINEKFKIQQEFFLKNNKLIKTNNYSANGVLLSSIEFDKRGREIVVLKFMRNKLVYIQPIEKYKKIIQVKYLDDLYMVSILNDDKKLTLGFRDYELVYVESKIGEDTIQKIGILDYKYSIKNLFLSELCNTSEFNLITGRVYLNGLIFDDLGNINK